MTHTRTPIRYLVPVLAAAFLLGACDDDPTTVEEHLDVEGVAIFEGATEIYRYTLDDGTPGTLTLTEGVHEVEFVLLDHDGDPIPEEGHDHDEEHVLEIDVEDTDILLWTPEAHDHEHEFVEFHGELTALQPGTTTMEVCLPHGTHCDFDADVPVTVVAQ